MNVRNDTRGSLYSSLARNKHVQSRSSANVRPRCGRNLLKCDARVAFTKLLPTPNFVTESPEIFWPGNLWAYAYYRHLIGKQEGEDGRRLPLRPRQVSGWSKQLFAGEGTSLENTKPYRADALQIHIASSSNRQIISMCRPSLGEKGNINIEGRRRCHLGALWRRGNSAFLFFACLSNTPLNVGQERLPWTDSPPETIRLRFQRSPISGFHETYNIITCNY